MKISRPILYLVVFGVVAYAGVVLTEPETPAKKTNPRRAAANSSKNDSIFTEEDYQAKFAPLNSTPRNAFRPIVAKSEGGAASMSNIMPSAVPNDFAGGEANWTFTGTVTEDGAMQALLENTSTGEAVFVRQGQYWKKASVVSINENQLVLRGPNGLTRTILMQGTVEPTARLAQGALPTGMVPPAQVQPPLTGQIGMGPLTVQPESGSNPTNAQNANEDPNAN